MAIHAIETMYKGIRYRSRLEATWAAFFDLVGWRYEYEPVDFNGWIPDFVLLGKSPVYVEVKPVYEFPEDVADKISQSGCENEVLIVGMTIPLPSEDSIGNLKLGWLSEHEGLCEPQRWWAEAIPGFWTNSHKQLDFCHSMGSYQGRINHGYDGGCYGENPNCIDIEMYIKTNWALAKNITQWKK